MQNAGRGAFPQGLKPNFSWLLMSELKLRPPGDVYEMASSNGGAISTSQVEEIYKNEMLGVHGRAELSHYEERLRLLGTAFYQTAVEFLTEAELAGQLRRLTAEGLAAEHPAARKTQAPQSQDSRG